MEVRTKSFQGFAIVGRGVPQEVVDGARGEVEAVLKTHDVTAAEIDALTGKFSDIGTGVDLQQFTAADWRRYGVDPKHVRANKHVHSAISAALKSAPAGAGRSLSLIVEPAHA